MYLLLKDFDYEREWSGLYVVVSIVEKAEKLITEYGERDTGLAVLTISK